MHDETALHESAAPRRKAMSQRKIVVVSIFIMLFAGLLFAQRPTDAAATVPCPHPITQTLTAPPPSPPTLGSDFSGQLGTAVAGSTWNQTNADHGFGHTFTLPPVGRECCIWTKGTLIVTVKALVAGPKGSSTSANDWVELVQNGAYVQGTGQQPFGGSNGATAGQTTSVTIPVPQSVLSSGFVSFHVQDDSAVLSATLRLEGCCIR